MAKVPQVPLWSNPAIMLFHGTTKNWVTSILGGVNVGRALATADFGRGFYTTTKEAQAWRWARLKAARFNLNPAVVRFTVDRDDLAKLAFMAFVRKDSSATDFWNFVRHCRLGGPNHSRPGQQQFYDVVVGPVVKQWGRRKIAFKDYDQVSFHTPRAATLLNNSSPKELP